MREIEFKFWNTKENKMVYIGNEGLYENAFLHENGAQQIVSLGTMMKLYFMIPLQYTGVKDKNEKKIYEGDVLRLTLHDCCGLGGDTFIVSSNRFHEDVIYLKEIQKNIVEGYDNGIELVGNVYENKKQRGSK